MARCLALHAAYGHGDDLAATGGQAGLHAGEAGVFPRASHQATLKAAAPNHQGIGLRGILQRIV